MGIKKGHRSTRNVGETDWKEPKKSRFLADMTSLGRRLLKELIAEWEISGSEFLERLARGVLIVRESTSIAELVAAKRGHLLSSTCLTEARLNELEGGAAITRSEVWTIAQALNIESSYIRRLADVCGIESNGESEPTLNLEDPSAQAEETDPNRCTQQN